MREDNYRAPEVTSMLGKLNAQWQGLVDVSLDKGRRLRQAMAQHDYNRTMDDAKTKLEELESSVKSCQVGSDLRNCKQLLKKHQVVKFFPDYNKYFSILALD